VDKQRKTPLWETKKVRVARQERNKAKRQYLKLKSSANKQKRRKAAKLLSQVIKEAVLNFESRIARNQDDKAFLVLCTFQDQNKSFSWTITLQR